MNNEEEKSKKKIQKYNNVKEEFISERENKKKSEFEVRQLKAGIKMIEAKQANLAQILTISRSQLSEKSAKLVTIS